MKSVKILITGIQGSGKTTQSKKIAAEFGLCIIKTGELMRHLSSEDSEIGRQIKKSLDQGALVDDQIVADVVRSALQLPNCRVGFVMDGYPRSIPQLRLFDPQFNLVFELFLTDEQATERMLLRKRIDDTPELIKKRLEIYHQETDAVIQYYKSQGIVHTINAAAAIEEVFDQIFGIIKKHEN